MVLVETRKTTQHLPEKLLAALKGLVVHDEVADRDGPLHRSIGDECVGTEDREDQAGLASQFRGGTATRDREALMAQLSAYVTEPADEEGP